jgi:hypothetical protein
MIMLKKERLLLLLIPILLSSAKADFEPPLGLNPGDVFYWVFVTSTKRDATSSNIEDYNKHVNDAADAATGPGKAVVGVSGKTLLGDIEWKAIASTETVNARDNIGNPSNGIYRLDGALIASNEGDLFDGTILAAINLTEILSPSAYAAWTGSYANGTRAYPLGKDPAQVMFGITSWTDSHWMYAGTDAAQWLKPLYAISESLTVIATNVPPVASTGGPYTGQEGAEVAFDGTGSYDPDGDALTYAWDFGDGSTGSGSRPDHTYVDNGDYEVRLTVTDPSGASNTQCTTTTISNVAPAVDRIAAPVDPVRLGAGEVCATADFVDRGSVDTHTAEWDWGDGGIGPGTLDEALGFGSVSDCHVYTEAGIYTIDLKVTDDDGDSGQSEFQYVVVYDPQGGFVTGGGWIDSPAGAYRPDPSLCGKANFGFVSKYKKGASTPTGQTEFVFRAGDLNFHSSSYDWLVVTGSNYARFKGSGTINGYGDYKFMLWAGDGPDTFRIRIWTEDAAGVETDVYDNGRDQPIGDGSIVIHTK